MSVGAKISVSTRGNANAAPLPLAASWRGLAPLAIQSGFNDPGELGQLHGRKARLGTVRSMAEETSGPLALKR